MRLEEDIKDADAQWRTTSKAVKTIGGTPPAAVLFDVDAEAWVLFGNFRLRAFPWQMKIGWYVVLRISILPLPILKICRINGNVTWDATVKYKKNKINNLHL